MTALEVIDVHKSYRKSIFHQPVDVLKGVSFKVPEGQITGFLGANGSGKTSTIKVIFDLIRADSGEVHFFGYRGLSPQVKRKIGFLPEHPYFYDYLTASEFLRFYGELSLGPSKKDLNERSKKLLRRIGLEHMENRKLRDFSKGMLQKIGVAQALIHQPSLVILDEPLSGLDPDGRKAIKDIIREASSEGTAVFFSSHLLNDAELLCDQLVILKEGQVCFQGETQNLLDRVSRGYSIHFEEKGCQQRMDIENLPGVQQAIKELIEKGALIREISSNRMHLEQAFIEMTFADRAEEILGTSSNAQGRLRKEKKSE